MKKLLLFKKLIIVILLAGMSLAGWAQVVLYEGFDYPVGSLVGGNTAIPSSSNNWATHSGSGGGDTIKSGSLSYSGLASSTGNMVYLFSNANATSRDINRAITSTATTLYFSALVKIVDISQLTAAGDYFMSFGATAGDAVPGLGARLGAKLGVTANTFNFIILNISGGTLPFVSNGVDLNFGTTYFVVVKYDISSPTSVATMWVNPVSLGGAEPTGGIVSNSGTNAFASFASICIRNSGSTPKANIDEIRVGATWADVTPVGGNVGISKRDQAIRQTAIFPNPATTFLNVKAPEGKYNVSVNNSIGSLVKSADLNSTGKIDLSDLHSGIYYVTIENEKTGLKEVHKLIVK